MLDFVMKLLALIGFLFFLASLMGALNLAEFHVYFGHDATKWHAKHAKESRDEQ